MLPVFFYSLKKRGFIMYQFIEDPGHGWLRVTLEELNLLGLVPEISSYSYLDSFIISKWPDKFS